jgi:hypothetical protein
LVSEESTREDAAAGISLPRVLCIFHQPGFNHLMIKSPLVTDLKPRKLFLAQQPIDCEFVHVEIFGDFVNSEQSFRGGLLFFIPLASMNGVFETMKARVIEKNFESHYQRSAGRCPTRAGTQTICPTQSQAMPLSRP